jgi:hypothetical protein
MCQRLDEDMDVLFVEETERTQRSSSRFNTTECDRMTNAAASRIVGRAAPARTFG